MVVAVLGLGEVLADESVRQMALDADGDGMVARLLPGVVLRLHDVAVHARLRIVADVRETLGVKESEAADTQQQAEQDREHNRAPSAPLSS